MEQGHTDITDEQRAEFTRLMAPLEEEMAKRAIDSWQVEPRPNPLAAFELDGMFGINDRRQVPPGHIVFRGDFESDK